MRHLLFLSVLLLGASWAAAQNYPSQTKTQAGTGGEITVQGCLSSSNGNYMLTDKHGNSFRLIGDAAKLSEHVGHEVKITGTKSSASASTSGESSKAGEARGSSQQELEVSSVKHISKTCQSGGMSY
jgi:hypothetical protein